MVWLLKNVDDPGTVNLRKKWGFEDATLDDVEEWLAEKGLRIAKTKEYKALKGE